MFGLQGSCQSGFCGLLGDNEDQVHACIECGDVNQAEAVAGLDRRAITGEAAKMTGIEKRLHVLETEVAPNVRFADGTVTSKPTA